MRFDDCLYDGEPHACALNAIALALTAVKLVEDHHPLEVVDPNATVGDAGHELPMSDFGADEDGASLRGVLRCVLEQVLQNLRDSLEIHLNERQRIGQAQL